MNGADRLNSCGLNRRGSLNQCLAEGARFEVPTVSETIGLDHLASVRSQSLTEESEADEEPVKPDRIR